MRVRWPPAEGGDLDLEEARTWDKSVLFGKYLHLPPPPAPQLPTFRSICTFHGKLSQFIREIDPTLPTFESCTDH